jgi:hypothetical protein
MITLCEPRFVVNIQRRLLTKTPHFAKTFIQKKMFQQQSFYTFNGKSSASFISKNDSCLNRFTQKTKKRLQHKPTTFHSNF